MSDDQKPSAKPEDTVPSKAAPHNPGLAPKEGKPSSGTKPAEGAPYDKKADVEQQPT